jgi:hypothetical protein
MVFSSGLIWRAEFDESLSEAMVNEHGIFWVWL